MKKFIILFLIISCFSVWANNDDHPMSKIIGDGIHLSTKDHTIAGRVGKQLVFGDVASNGHKTSSITLKTDDGVIHAEFGFQNGVWGGEIASPKKTLKIKLIEMQSDVPAYIISFNDKTYRVRIEAKDFRDNHFIKPSYVLELENGQEVRASMQEGQACYMYSLHLMFLIFGSYLY